jgi:hypothetical protein
MKRALCIAPALLLAACGGGGPAAVPATRSGPSASDVTVEAKITIPAAGSTSNRALKRIYDAASTTQGILLTVYPVSGTPAQATTVTGGDISGDAASSCTASGSGRICTVAFAAPPGNSNLLAQTYTQVISANGTVPGGVSVLGAGSTSLSIVPASGVNSVNLTLNPVLASVKVTPVPTTLRTLIPSTFGVLVTGLDASGSIIVAGQYVDQNANPTSATLALSLASIPSGSLVLSPTTVGAPGTVVTGTYRGNANVTSASSFTITSAAPFASSATMTIVPPTVVAYPLPQLGAEPTTYMGISAVTVGGNDPQIWFMSTLSPGYLIQYDIAAKTTVATAAQNGGGVYPFVGGMAVDSTENNVYFGGSGDMYWAPNLSPSPAPVPFLPCGTNCTLDTTTSGLAWDSNPSTIFFGSGSNIVTYDPVGQGFENVASCLPTCTASASFAGVRYNGNGVFLADNEANGAVYDYINGPLYATATGYQPFDVALSSNQVWITQPAGHWITGFAAPIANGEGAGESIPTSGAPQYLVFDTNVSNNQLYWDETASGGGVIIGSVNPQNGYPGEIPIGAAGGIAGPIVEFPNSATLGIVHYTSSGNGEFLVVYP